MKPVKTDYNDDWMRANPGLRTSECEIAGFITSDLNKVSPIDIRDIELGNYKNLCPSQKYFYDLYSFHQT